jgi:hypothetical protein
VQEIFATRNGSYKLFLQVNNFNGCVRIGITKQIWCEEANSYVFAKKGHCYFPAEACDALQKFLPAAKTEANRVEKQVNGYSSAGAFARNGPAGTGRAFGGASKPQQRRDDGNAWPLNVAITAASAVPAPNTFGLAGTSASAGYVADGEQQHPGKRRDALVYKTEEETNGLEQGSPKKLCIANNDEETIAPKKVQAVERSIFRRG